MSRSGKRELRLPEWRWRVVVTILLLIVTAFVRFSYGVSDSAADGALTFVAVVAVMAVWMGLAPEDGRPLPRRLR